MRRDGIGLCKEREYKEQFLSAEQFFKRGREHNAVLGDGVLSIGNRSFSGCVKLTSVRLGNNLTTVGDYAFDECSSLKEIVIPDSVTSLGQYAFWDCKSLESAVIGEGVSVLDYYLFHTCLNLKSVKFGSNVTTIDGMAFYNCVRLERVEFPAGLTSINGSAFENCDSLTSVWIPLSVTKMSRAFLNCDSLTIYCEAASTPSGWESYWNSSNIPVVWDCNNNDVATDGYIYTVIGGIRYGLKNGFAEVVKQPINITEANIPSQILYKETVYYVTKIREGAFKGCNSLTTMTLPFLGTGNGAGTYLAVFGAIFGYDITTNGVDPAGTICQYSVYTSTYGYKYYHYYIPSSLKTVNVTDGNISNYSFKECNSLTHMEIPDGLSVIKKDAFRNCSALASIVLPTSVTTVEEDAFLSCNSLAKIYYKGTAAEFLQITIGSWNNEFESATIYYYVENESEVPAGGNYWHYDEKGEVAIW